MLYMFSNTIGSNFNIVFNKFYINDTSVFLYHQDTFWGRNPRCRISDIGCSQESGSRRVWQRRGSKYLFLFVYYQNIVVKGWIKVFNHIHFMTDYSRPGRDNGLVNSDMTFIGYGLGKYFDMHFSGYRLGKF